MTRRWIFISILFIFLSAGFGGRAFPADTQEEPPLPEGLEKSQGKSEEPKLPEGLDTGSQNKPAEEEPSLPEGLEKSKGESGEPALPEGLDTGTKPSLPAPSARKGETHPKYDVKGFVESRFGVRTQRDPRERDVSIGEARSQIELEIPGNKMGFILTSDFLYDPVLDRHDVRLEEGTGAVDLRKATWVFTPAGFADLKAGRQILTWGTGDLIFINDLFPKDWNSFFIGRDEEYLKAPSDALKVSLFSRLANLDVAYTPRFDPDRFIDGRRVSFFNPQYGRRTGRDAVVETENMNDWFRDDELAVRLFKNIRGTEMAAYGYWGYWKSPAGFDPASGQSTFPALSVYGASLRGVVLKGIGNLEFGWYDSRDDRDGTDPTVRNGEIRFLAGYEQELGTDFTAGIQYYLEHILDHGALVKTLPPGVAEPDEYRHLLTLRLTKLLLNQNLTLSLFTFYSPSDDDAYLRPKVRYKLTDSWLVETGGNVFFGSEDRTFFAQFERNSNLYFALRYGF